MPEIVKRKNNAPRRGAHTSERIFNWLIEALVTGEFAAGRPMREAEVAKRWGVSRTPMREAVRRVSEFGLLILRRNRAPLVRAFTPQDIDCIYKIREVMESLALNEAWDIIPAEAIRNLQMQAKKATPGLSKGWINHCLAFDESLHQVWLDHCRNPWLTESLRRTRIFIRIFQRFMARDEALVRRSYREHCRILKTLGTRDKSKGIACLRKHIRNSQATVKACLEASG